MYLSRRLFFRFLLALVLVGICVTIQAQEPQVSQIAAPPPINAISKEERAQLDSNHDTKQRLRLALELAATHLAQAEKFTAESNFEAASSQVGCYHALIQNALASLSSQKREANKIRDLYKRLELSLRSDGPRLTAMRRITPIEFAVWIKEVEDFARESRTAALNSFYGTTVVKETTKEEENKATDKPKDPPTPSRTP